MRTFLLSFYLKFNFRKKTVQEKDSNRESLNKLESTLVYALPDIVG